MWKMDDLLLWEREYINTNKTRRAIIMAKNRPIGDNSRVGAVKGRTQVYNPTTG